MHLLEVGVALRSPLILEMLPPLVAALPQGRKDHDAGVAGTYPGDKESSSEKTRLGKSEKWSSQMK